MKDFIHLDTVRKMKNGCALNGVNGIEKYSTAIYFYFSRYGGRFDPEYIPMNANPPDLYLITTREKCESMEFSEALLPFLLYTDLGEVTCYGNKVVIDSWDNMNEYADIKDAFFIFDRDRLIDDDIWVEPFLKLAKTNEWIVLSTSIGYQWENLVPIFIANGFFKSRHDFENEHVECSRSAEEAVVEHYKNTRYLLFLRDQVVVDMNYGKPEITDWIIKFSPEWSDVDKISHLQRRVLVYSSLYYDHDTSLPNWSDYQYDKLSRFVAKLMQDHPDAKESRYYYVFYDFEGFSGHHLLSRLNESDRDVIKNIVNDILDERQVI